MNGTTTGTSEARGTARPVTVNREADRLRDLLRLKEGEREQDRSLISRQQAALERQAELLKVCRRALGDNRFETLKREQLDS
jgi:hypothetical protein